MSGETIIDKSLLLSDLSPLLNPARMHGDWRYDGSTQVGNWFDPVDGTRLYFGWSTANYGVITPLVETWGSCNSRRGHLALKLVAAVPLFVSTESISSFSNNAPGPLHRKNVAHCSWGNPPSPKSGRRPDVRSDPVGVVRSNSYETKHAEKRGQKATGPHLLTAHHFQVGECQLRSPVSGTT